MTLSVVGVIGGRETKGFLLGFTLTTLKTTKGLRLRFSRQQGVYDYDSQDNDPNGTETPL